MDKMIDVTSKRFPDIGTGSEETHGILITKKKSEFVKNLDLS